MVGLVLVSHSWKLAEGAAELAREMGGPEVKLETAGGLDAPDHPVGTDAVLVVDAIERAWSDDGVVVLMDLGSAVLSAEMALEMLPEDKRDKVLLCEAPFIEGAVAAAVTAKLGASAEQVAAEARGGLAPKVAHLGGEAAPAETPEAFDATQARSIRLVVANPHGLHARPAARFVQIASGFDADVRVANVSAGRGPVTARSLNAVATLGVGKGDEIEVLATGAEAERALEAVRGLADRGFDEEIAPEEPVATGPVSAAPAGALAGVATSPGVALGVARRFRPPVLEVPEREATDPAAEIRALEDALEITAEDVDAQRAAIAGRAGEYQAAIFDAHRLFLQDEMLLDPVRAAIRDQGRSAPAAWSAAVEAMAAEWEALEDEYMRARAADLRSVGLQVLAHLLGVPPPRPRLEGPGILVAPDLTPADATGLDPALALGIATAFGGPTSHAAILARSLGIPAVVGLGEPALEVAEGTALALDADAGLLYVEPSAELTAHLEERRRARAEADRSARAEARAPAITLDGATVEVAANVGSPEEIAAAVEAGCDGVGLFRTEFLFMERGRMPSEDEQEAAYRRAAEALDGRPLVIRTLDVGADKPLPYLAQPPEPNPFLGIRGLRLGLERPELLETQLRAIVRVAADHPLRVMFPMVATVEELRAARAALDAAAEAVGVPHPEDLQVGIMVEVPSAALTASALAPGADFFSVGTNDLTQYTLAADRGNERVAALSDALHPAVLRLIAATCAAAAEHDRWVGVCGELAGDEAATPVLLGLGVTELSMSAPAIPGVKRAVRAVDLERARELASRALQLPSAGAVRELLAGGAD
ncbi:MAG TPA: phosphoenolpyruvate--protein phosphotransferase [Actinomycetota bacterium]|nr:phosphoenolpyruvate--protein phosphotransferase [Actinomycetota bacterium]